MLRTGSLAAVVVALLASAVVQAQESSHQLPANRDYTLSGRLRELQRSVLGERNGPAPTPAPAEYSPRVAARPKTPPSKFNGGKFSSESGRENFAQSSGGSPRTTPRATAPVSPKTPPRGNLFEYAAPEGSFSTLNDPIEGKVRNPSSRSAPAARKVTDDETGVRPSTARTASPPPAYREEQTPKASSSRRTAQPDYRLGDDAGSAPDEPVASAMPRANLPARAGGDDDAAPSEDETPAAAGNAPAAIDENESGLYRPRLNGDDAPVRTARRNPLPPRAAVKEEPASDENAAVTEEIGPAKKPEAASPRESRDGVLLTHKAPAVEVETLGPKKIVVGVESAYKILVRNRGESSAKDVIVTIDLPVWAEVTLADPTQGEVRLPGSEGGAELQWSISEVAARGMAELSLRLLPRKHESFELTMHVAQAASESASRVEVQEPKLTLVLAGPKEVSFGEKAVYKLTFANPGTADAQNVVVRLLPIGAADGPMDLHEIGTIRAGENKVVEMELVARQSGVVAIKAEAHADGGLRASLAEEVLVIRPDLKLETEGPKFQYARTVVNYKIRVSNPGNAELKNVQVTAQLPSQASFVSSTGGGQSDKDGSHVVWSVRSIAAGGHQEFMLKVQLGSTGLNRLQVNATAGDLKDNAIAATEVAALADLALDVTEPEGAFPLGEEVTYELRVKNRGTKTAEAVDVVMYFAQGLDAASASGAKHELTDGKVQFATIPSISPGKEVVLKVRAKANEAGNHVYRAEALCDSLSSKLGKEGTTRFYSDVAAPQKQSPASSEGQQ